MRLLRSRNFSRRRWPGPGGNHRQYGQDNNEEFAAHVLKADAVYTKLLETITTLWSPLALFGPDLRQDVGIFEYGG